MTLSNYPVNLDVFMQLVDGFHPITADDRNSLQNAIRQIQETLGAGVSRTTGGTTYGCKGANADLKTRLDTLFDTDGGIKDIAFVTGTVQFGQLSYNGVGNGFRVNFGKTLSDANYGVLFEVQVDEVDSSNYITGNAPACWYVSSRTASHCVITAAKMDGGGDMDPSDTRTARFALLAIGRQAAYA